MVLPAGLIEAILAQYSLPRNGIHGPSHWARVLEHGLVLAKSTGADIEVVKLFAIFHDSQRLNEGIDPGHGRRAAHFARSFRGRYFDLDHAQFELLSAACASHTDGQTEADVTIQTCWDSDRLDLGRVGIEVDPSRLCTEAARDAKLIARATKGAKEGRRPGFMSDWP